VKGEAGAPQGLIPRHRDPVVDGRELRERALHRLRRRMDLVRVTRPEREELELERRLRAPPLLTRPNVIAVVSPRGGVGKTTATFLAGNLLASHLKLRAIAVDANPGFGTLGRLARGGHPERSMPDLLGDLDRIATASDVRGYVSVLPTGLHLIGAAGARLEVGHYGRLLALLSCFYDAVLLDLGPGATRPLARLAIERADQLVAVTTPDRLTAKVVLHALDHLEADATTVLINRAHPHPAGEVREVEDCFRGRRPHRLVTIPNDRRLAAMLATGTYSLEALDSRTRLPVKQLGVAVAEQLV
jgi:MinD-like ATPase involved in chromosome partitioning or flagellar assembly